jgi:predicted outer membrane repeat protein
MAAVTRRACRLFSVVLAVGGSLSSSSKAGQLTVPTADYPTLQAAIDASADGDEIVVTPGTYSGSGNVNLILAGKAVTLRSADPNDPNVVEATVIDGGLQNQCLLFVSQEGPDTVVAGLTICRGVGTAGGGAFCVGSSPTFLHCVIRDCSALYGAGIYSESTQVRVISCTFSGNVATSGGGIWNNAGTPTIRDCTFVANTASIGGGGAIVNASGGDAAILACTFSGNVSVFGGGIFSVLSAPVIEDCSFEGNVGGHGGGVYNLQSDSTLRQCAFLRNTAYWGAGVDNYDHSRAVITGCLFQRNQATWGGAMVDFGGSSSTVDDSDFVGNSTVGAYGGAICCGDAGASVLRRCIFVGNEAQNGSGGAIACQDNCTPTIADCDISGNRCDFNGGGVYLEQSSASIRNCIIAGNVAGLFGGGIICFGDAGPVIGGSIISGNWAGQYGGGLACAEGVNPTIESCALTGNAADAVGGGIGVADGSTPTLRNCVLWGNASAVGKEIAILGGTTPAAMTVAYCDVRGGTAEAYVDPNSVLAWNDGNLDADPCFAHGASGQWSRDAHYDDVSGHVTFTDASAAWTGGQWAGAMVQPDASQPMRLVVITNTATTLTTWADAETLDRGASPIESGFAYRIIDTHLTQDSPCVDAGDPQTITTGQTDIDQQLRANGVVDIGPDEYWAGSLVSLNLEVVNALLGEIRFDPEPDDPANPVFPVGTVVTLTAVPNDGREFGVWRLYDPNFPDDANSARLDANASTTIMMDTNRRVTAAFDCGEGVGAAFLFGALGVLALMGLERVTRGPV